MSKLIAFVLMLCVSVFAVVRGSADKPDYVETEIYIVDGGLMRLIPISEQILEGDREFMAKQCLRRLIRGYDKNKKIRRLIPADYSCMSLKLNRETAYINIKTKYFEGVITNRDIERLLVYQIVNTITAVDGIDTVKFTLDGKSSKRWGGYLDLRNVFFPEQL